MRKNLAAVLTAVCAVMSLGSHATAQCDSWNPGDGMPGLSGPCYAVCTWDPDGDGPRGECIVAAGNFTVGGSTRVRRIALWEGVEWASLGVLEGTVRAVAVFRGELFAAGSTNDAAYVSRWNGTSWEQISGVIEGGLSVRSLAVFNDRLLAGGRFTSIAGTPAASIASWDGTSWTSFGGGMTSGSTVYDIELDGTDLYVTGSFTSAGPISAKGIAKWNGTAWQAVASGLPGIVHTAARFGDSIYFGGTFLRSAGAPADHICRWNGSSFSSVGLGLDKPVYDLRVYDSRLIAGGEMRYSGTTETRYIAAWNGTEWSGVNRGVNGGPVNALTVHNGKLVVGGSFTLAGDMALPRIASWSSEGWGMLGRGFDGPIYDLKSFQGELFATGDFMTAGRGRAPGIARWDGAEWNAMAGGLNGFGYAIESYQGQLVVAGRFTNADGTTVNNVARWNGEHWIPFGDGLTTPLQTATARALVEYNGDLIVGGSFQTAGEATNVGGIARWDGSTWHAMGSGTSGSVTTLGVHNGELFVAGGFTSVDGVPHTFGIARWNGTEWLHAGGPLTGYSPVEAFADYNGELIAGGGFKLKSDGNRIARWTGSDWASYAPRLSNSFFDLAVHQGQLYTVGAFSIAAGDPGEDMLRWNGHQWLPVISNGYGFVSDVARVLEMHGNTLHVAGEFTNAGAEIRSNWASFDIPLAPYFTLEPVDQSICKSQQVTLTVEAQSSRPLTYQWYRDGSPLVDGATASGALIEGSTTDRLDISGSTSAEQGSYSCAVDDGCSTSFSQPATLVVCRADFDCTGFVDTDDFTSFVLAFEAGSNDADIDDTGFVDTDDFTAFVLAFEAGC